MPTTVYTLLCQTDRTGHVLAVFTDRAQAAEVARANAATHAERLRRQDEKIFKASIADDVYQVHVEDLGSNFTVFIRHRFLDEAETYRWLVDSFELVPHRQMRTDPAAGVAPSTLQAMTDTTAPAHRRRVFCWDATAAESPMTGKMDQSSTRVRALNDELRRFRRGGRIMITPGIQALGDEAVARVLTAVAAFDAFTDRNDPYSEHDCAILAVDGIEVLFKIDYYDRDLVYHSPDPGDPAVTQRIMVVMLASEY